MTRKARVQRTPEEKWEIVWEGLRSGNIAETCRRYGIAPNLYYRWKDEGQQGAMAALGGRALPRRRTSRSGASGNWSGRWDGRRWRRRS
jgi:transposase-like protein